MLKISGVKIHQGKQNYFLNFSRIDICSGEKTYDKFMAYYDIKKYTNDINIIIPEGVAMYNYVVFNTKEQAQKFVDKLMPQIILNRLSIGG